MDKVNTYSSAFICTEAKGNSSLRLFLWQLCIVKEVFDPAGALT